MPIVTHHQFNAPIVESRIDYKVEDDRTLGEKAKDAVSNAAHIVKEAFTPEVNDMDIAKALDKQYEIEKKEMKYAEKANKQAEKVSLLQNKQAEQQAEKYLHAMKHNGLCHGNVDITRVTDIH